MGDRATDGPAGRVLVAEDDPHRQMLLIMAAERTGATLEFGFLPDGEELLGELRHLAADGRLPDIAVLGPGIPGPASHAVLDVLWRERWLRPAEVGLVARADDPERLEDGLARGATWCEAEPTRFGELVDLVDGLQQRCRDLRRAASPTVGPRGQDRS